MNKGKPADCLSSWGSASSERLFYDPKQEHSGQLAA